IAAPFALCAGQKHRDDTEVARPILDATRDGRPHLLVLPRPDSARADEDGAAFALRQGVFDVRLIGFARNEIEFVEPRLDLLLLKTMVDILDSPLVGGVMRQENVNLAEARHAYLENRLYQGTSVTPRNKAKISLLTSHSGSGSSRHRDFPSSPLRRDP